MWQDVQQVQVQRGGAGWRYQRQTCPVRKRREVQDAGSRDKRRGAGWEGVLRVQMQKCSMTKYQRIRVRVNGTGGRKEGWTCG